MGHMKKIKLLIVVSLLLNMVLGGMLLGMGMREHDRSPVAALKVWGTNELPEEKRASFNAMMQKLEKDTEGVRQQVIGTRKEMYRQLSAEPYNKQAYLATVAKFQRLMKSQMQQFTLAVANYAAELTPEERASLATMLERRPPGRFSKNPLPEKATEVSK